MKRLDERIEPERYVTLPDEWPVPKNLSLLHVTSCKHFRKEGIRKGNLLEIKCAAMIFLDLRKNGFYIPDYATIRKCNKKYLLC